ncbi:MAG: 3-oxoacid CoA-transferase subunit B [Synergistales bacterium]|nr:3-oxoacid CoA-transferase subunit B [Synergistales bacterium]
MLPELDKDTIRNRIARRIAQEFHDGQIVNLGIGIPTLVSDYIPEGVRIIFQTENGAVCAGPKPEEPDLRFIGAGGRPLSILPGGALIPSDLSFGLIRGGHLDATVLGALQVDESADLASWMVPGKRVPGMGGSMDLVTGAKRVIIATTHTTKKGEAKLIPKCTFPLTGIGVVSMVVTEYCVMRFQEGKMVLTELAPQVTVDDLREVTEARFETADEVKTMLAVEEEVHQ